MTDFDKFFSIHFEKKFNEIEYYENWKLSIERIERLTKEMLVQISFKLWKISEICNMQLTPIITELV